MISLIVINDEIVSIEMELCRLKEKEKERKLYKEEKELMLKFSGALVELYALNEKIKNEYKKYID